MKPSTLALPTFAAGARGRHPPPANIVDQLIAERAPGLVATAPGRWLLRRVLHPLLDYGTAVELAQRAAPLGGHAVFELMRQVLAQRLVVSGLEHVPASGRFIAVSNHPTGLADGIAVHSALRRARPDLWFLANADALRVAPGLAEIIVPIEWDPTRRNHGKTREMLQATSRILGREQALVIFPSGRLSYFSWRGLAERPWQATVVALARRYEAPILPMRLVARNSALFYALSQLSSELRDITLFHELLNKRERLFEIQIAPLIDPGELDGDPMTATAGLQRYVERGLRNRGILHPRRRTSDRLALAAAR